MAHGASKTNKSRLKKVYLRLLRRKGKPKAITALSRKILSMIHHLLVNREMWEEEEEGFKKKRLDFFGCVFMEKTGNHKDVHFRETAK